MTTMDFFGHQEQARKATGRLVTYFVLAVLGITACIYAAARALLYFGDDHRPGMNWALLAVVTVTTLGIIGLAMLFKTAQLKSGGGKVASLLGGRLVDLDTKDPQERVLRNLVEEMAIASGVPVPEIYVLDQETAINAFAAGWTSTDAAVAVTRGCLEQLDRDQLQGVIAHEFSHVFNGDMRLNIRLMGVLFGIVCIATIGRIIVRTVGSSSSSDKKGGAAGVVVFGIVVIAVGYLGVFFAHLIQAAVSRQREFLADASAVQFTRNPRGIGVALAKIGGLDGSKLKSVHTEEASHMLFADGINRFMGGAMATHPPLEQRIERVLPGFLKQLREAPSMVDAAAATPSPAGVAGFAGAGPAVAGIAAASQRSVAPQQVVRAVGDPQPEHVVAARRLLDALPLDVAAAAREPVRAHALVVAMLLDADATRREVQMAMLVGHEPAFVHDVHVMFQEVTRLDRGVRLPLLELAMPGLRRLPAPMRRTLREEARRLALADGVLSPFEFALLRTIERHVSIAGEELRRMPGSPEALVQHAGATAVVLSVLARVGAPDDERLAAIAFARGREHLTPGPDLQLLDAAKCSVLQLEAAVDDLAKVSPLGKRNLIAACAEAVAADGRIDPDELDLLRALAELWDCPVPLLNAA